MPPGKGPRCRAGLSRGLHGAWQSHWVPGSSWCSQLPPLTAEAASGGAGTPHSDRAAGWRALVVDRATLGISAFCLVPERLTSPHTGQPGISLLPVVLCPDAAKRMGQNHQQEQSSLGSKGLCRTPCCSVGMPTSPMWKLRPGSPGHHSTPLPFAARGAAPSITCQASGVSHRLSNGGRPTSSRPKVRHTQQRAHACVYRNMGDCTRQGWGVPTFFQPKTRGGGLPLCQVQSPEDLGPILAWPFNQPVRSWASYPPWLGLSLLICEVCWGEPNGTGLGGRRSPVCSSGAACCPAHPPWLCDSQSRQDALRPPQALQPRTISVQVWAPECLPCPVPAVPQPSTPACVPLSAPLCSPNPLEPSQTLRE